MVGVGGEDGDRGMITDIKRGVGGVVGREEGRRSGFRTKWTYR